MSIKVGVFSVMLVVLGGCATNCKLKGQVLGVLRRQNAVLDSLLKSRNNAELSDIFNKNQSLKSSEQALVFSVNKVIESNNKIVGGIGGSCY